MTDVTHLEIPADLALVFANIQGKSTTLKSLDYEILSKSISTVHIILILNLARVVNAIHRINHYPVDSVVCFVNIYPLDSDLSGGYRYPAFEQLAPG